MEGEENFGGNLCRFKGVDSEESLGVDMRNRLLMGRQHEYGLSEISFRFWICGIREMQ
jgi:hypothetical protein